MMLSLGLSSQPVQNEYGAPASSYDRRWSNYLQATVAATLARIPLSPGDKLLDVGCGTGLLLHAIADRQALVLLAGVDLSLPMLHRAHTRLVSPAALVNGDATHLPFASASVDVIVSSCALHYAPRLEDALAEITRVLRPGGRLVLTDWCTDYVTTWVIDRLLQRGDRAHTHAFGSGQLHRLLVQSGYKDITIERYKIDWLWGLMTASATAAACGAAT